MCVPKCLPRLLFILIVASISLIGGPGYAQNAVPMLINYEGEIRLPATGDPVPDGTYSMHFKIYDVETGGTHLWEEHHSAAHGNPVQVRRGVFSVLLGSGMGDVLNASVFSGSDRWLEVSIETETMSPRQRITSTAYSVVSEDSHLLDGNPASAFAEAVHSHSGTDIVSGTVPEGRVDATITRDTEVDSKITSHAGIADAHHVKTTSFSELTGTLSEAQIPPTIARDSEVSGEIAAHEGVIDAHHPRYTDSEATAAMGAKSNTNPLNHDKTMSLPWGNIADVPPGFADGEDNDSTYTAGAGLSLLDTQFNVDFAGEGSADSASHSDHHHDGAYALELHEHDASAIVSGMLDPARFSAYDDLAAEGHLDGDAGTDLMTIDGGKGTYWALGGNGGTNPGDHFVGTTDNQPLEVRVNNGRALRLEPGSSPNIIGGYVTNSAEAGAVGATVGGGGEAGFANRVTDDFGTVGGGRNNQAGDDAGTTSDKAYASVGGGAGNLASGMYATVGGGLGNQSMADYATIAGGGRVDPANPLLGNSVFDHYGSIGGGGNNRAGSDDGDPTNATYATVGGGGTNWATGQGATIGGGFVNEASGFAATVPGGDSNTASGEYSVVGGGLDNQADANYATIAGGGPSDLLDPSITNNRVTDDYGSISGGANNQAGDNAGTSSDANFATVGGGHTNAAGAFSATVAGGAVNTANAPWAGVRLYLGGKIGQRFGRIV